MFNVKKLISFSVSLTFLFNLFVPTTGAFASKLYDSCNQINDSNIYCCDDYNCRVDKNILNSGKDYVFLRKDGAHTDKVNHYFSFKDLDRIFNLYKIEPTDQFKTKWRNLEAESERYSLNFKNILKIGCSSLVGAISGQFIGVLSNGKNMQKRRNRQDNGLNNRAYVKRSTLSNVAYLIGAGVTGISSLIYFIVKKNLSKDWISKKRHENHEEWKKTDKLNDKKQFILNLMLRDLESTNYYSNGIKKDAFLIGENESGFTFNSCSLDLTYTEEEKATLPDRLKKLASEIRQNLEEHDMLSDYNKIDDKDDSRGL